MLNELPRIIKLQIPFGLIVLAAIGHSRALPVEVADRVVSFSVETCRDEARQNSRRLYEYVFSLALLYIPVKVWCVYATRAPSQRE